LTPIFSDLCPGIDNQGWFVQIGGARWRPPMNDDLHETARFLGISTAIWFWFLLLTACGIGFFWKIEPYFMQQETQNTRQSNAYITSKQSALRTWMLSWQELDNQRREIKDPALREGVEAQQKGIVRQMKQDADTIPNSVQPDIKSFLSTH
jgi:Tfp pilus assembly protein PilN